MNSGFINFLAFIGKELCIQNFRIILKYSKLVLSSIFLLYVLQAIVLADDKPINELLLIVDNYGDKEWGSKQFSSFLNLNSPFNLKESIRIEAYTTEKPKCFKELNLNINQPINDQGSSFNIFSSVISENYETNMSIPNDNTYALSVGLAKDINVFQVSGNIYYNQSDYYKTEQKKIFHDYRYNSFSQEISLKYSPSYLSTKLSWYHGLGGSFKNFSNNNRFNLYYNLVYLNLSVDYQLKNNWSIYANNVLQYSHNQLPDHALLAFGGRDFGRGYSWEILEGNKGYGLVLELRYNKNIDYNLINSWQYYMFYDLAYISKIDYFINSKKISSIGAGIKISLSRQWDFGLEIANPLNRSITFSEDTIKYPAKIGIFLSKKIAL